MIPTPIYLDNNATTKVAPEVLDAMMPYFQTEYGNPSSTSHAFGWRADEAVEFARQQVATLLNCTPHEVTWTSGATESNNLAIKGSLIAQDEPGAHIITVRTEHSSVIDIVKHLVREGAMATFLPVDRDGLVSLSDLEAAITPETRIVSIMAVNNEIGTIQPIAEIGSLCKSHGIVFHTDATQAIGAVPVDVDTMSVDLLSCSAHKFHGPKGVGALYVRSRDPRTRIVAQMDGGGQEHGFRSGTLNVPGIVGMGTAAGIAHVERSRLYKNLALLRDSLWHRIEAEIPNVELNGHSDLRSPANLNVWFTGADADAIMLAMPQVAIASGSACTSNAIRPSHVIASLNKFGDSTKTSLRFGVSRFNTMDEIDACSKLVRGAVQRVRAQMRRV